jgi:hypothetical protein
MAYRIQFRRDTTANWTSINPILLQGEFAYSLDTGFAKIGDGSSTWSQLTYFGGTGPTGPTGIVGPTGSTGPSVSVLGSTGYVFSPGASGIGFTGSGISDITSEGNYVTVTITSGSGPTGATGNPGATGADSTVPGPTGPSVTVSDVPPGSSGAAGATGDLALDSDWLYVCVGTNTWKRTALTSWV